MRRLMAQESRYAAIPLGGSESRQPRRGHFIRWSSAVNPALDCNPFPTLYLPPFSTRARRLKSQSILTDPPHTEGARLNCGKGICKKARWGRQCKPSPAVKHGSNKKAHAPVAVPAKAKVLAALPKPAPKPVQLAKPPIKIESRKNGEAQRLGKSAKIAKRDRVVRERPPVEERHVHMVPIPEAVPTDGKPRKNQAGFSPRDLERYRDSLMAKRRELVGDMSAMESEALRTSGGTNLSNAADPHGRHGH